MKLFPPLAFLFFLITLFSTSSPLPATGGSSPGAYRCFALRSPPLRSPSSSNSDLLISHHRVPGCRYAHSQLTARFARVINRTKRKDQASKFHLVTLKKSDGCTRLILFLTGCQMLLQTLFCRTAMDFLHVHRATRGNRRHSRECFIMQQRPQRGLHLNKRPSVRGSNF